jgi:hypothetical protein
MDLIPAAITATCVCDRGNWRLVLVDGDPTRGVDEIQVGRVQEWGGPGGTRPAEYPTAFTAVVSAFEQSEPNMTEAVVAMSGLRIGLP